MSRLGQRDVRESRYVVEGVIHTGAAFKQSVWAKDRRAAIVRAARVLNVQTKDLQIDTVSRVGDDSRRDW